MRAVLWLALQLQVPAPTGYVNDFAGIVRPAAARAMRVLIDDVRAKSPGEIVVVTLRDLGGRAPIDVARDMGRQWRVGRGGQPGDVGRNAGVVLLLTPGERPGDGRAQVAIASGTGAEGFITDALSGRIADAVGREAVNAGQYDAGLLAGVGLLAEAYAREYGFTLSSGPEPRTAPEPAQRRNGYPWGIVIVLVLFFLLGGGRRRRVGLLEGLLLGSMLGGRRRGGWHSGGGFGGGFGGGGFGGFGGGGGSGGGGASRSF